MPSGDSPYSGDVEIPYQAESPEVPDALPAADGTGSKNSRRVEGKLCGVCGDKALGYNFNAITCESCKAFFRRNALKNKEFRCPFNDICEVTSVTRRFCQKCRLHKCFEVGMKKEWIMTDEEKVKKKRKIEENRARKKGDLCVEESSSNSLSPEPPPTPLSEQDDSLPFDDGGEEEAAPLPLFVPMPSTSREASKPQAVVIGRVRQKEDIPAKIRRLSNHVDVCDSREYAEFFISPHKSVSLTREIESSNRVQESFIPMQEIQRVSKMNTIVPKKASVINAIPIDSQIASPHDPVAKSSFVRTDSFDISPASSKLVVTPKKRRNSPSLTPTPTPHLLEGNAICLPLLENLQNEESSSNYNIATSSSGSSVNFPSAFNENAFVDRPPTRVSPIDYHIKGHNATHGLPIPEPLLPQISEKGQSFAQSPTCHFSSSLSAYHQGVIVKSEVEGKENLIESGGPKIVHCDNKTNVDLPIEEPPSSQATDHQGAFAFDIQKSLKLLQPGCKHLKTSHTVMDSIWNSAVRSEYSAFSKRKSPNPHQLNEAEEMKLNELYEANKYLLAPLCQDSNFKDSSDQSLVNVVNLTGIAIRRLIKMAKRITAFKNFCQEDQIALLKAGCAELMVLQSVSAFNPDKESWMIPQDQDSFKNIKLKILKSAPGNIYEEHKQFLMGFQPDWRQDHSIMLLLSAIALFTPERPCTIHIDTIRHEQSTYLFLLKRYLDCKYGFCEGSTNYYKLLERISQLHMLNDDHVKIFLELNPKELEPLLIEMFDLEQQS